MMDRSTRRELFRRLVGATAAAGISPSIVKASAVTAPEENGLKAPALIVIECDQRLGKDAAANLRASWNEAIKGSPFEDVKVAILDASVRLTVLGADGRVMNEPISPAVVVQEVHHHTHELPPATRPAIGGGWGGVSDGGGGGGGYDGGRG